MSNHATQVIDASGPVATSSGTALTLFSWFATWDWGFLIGVLIGLAGLCISYANYRTNKQFQIRKDQREQQLHEFEMSLRGNKNAEQD